VKDTGSKLDKQSNKGGGLQIASLDSIGNYLGKGLVESGNAKSLPIRRTGSIAKYLPAS
jgi:hypothetical protein